MFYNEKMNSHVEAILKKYAALVNPVIKKMLAQGVTKQTRELLHYQISTGGKRLRPALAILSCLACGGKLQDALYPAAGLEILHNYTLIIDDIIDNSPKRRGKPTCWKKFGRSFAECIGIDYGATILQVIVESKSPKKVSAVYAKALKTIMDGEMEDVLLEQAGREEEPFPEKHRITRISLPLYKRMIGAKTASLFRASCELGAITANAPLQKVETLKTYGWHLGVAFQITDDVLDICGVNTGKPRGQDIREHKLGNILIFFALKELPLKNKLDLTKILRMDSPGNEDIKKAIMLIETTSAKKKAVQQALWYESEAKRALAALPPSQSRLMLEEIVDFVGLREY
ncbi:MAG TPA: polyprenyl synthetase family protein [Candidatus Wildermuthbacteria bacterium]|nr:polyprenyl synthetase family protein [Candidatus Wildermuthbacteria bacterium]